MSSREAIRKATRDELDKQFKKDLREILETPAGRRVFSYLLMSSGANCSMPTGTYVDHYNAGRRSIGIELTFACNSIDYPTKLSGLDIRQEAEREYMLYQLAVAEDIESGIIREQKKTMKGRVDGAIEKG